LIIKKEKTTSSKDIGILVNSNNFSNN